jgi:hypothetical protein
MNRTHRQYVVAALLLGAPLTASARQPLTPTEAACRAGAGGTSQLPSRAPDPAATPTPDAGLPEVSCRFTLETLPPPNGDKLFVSRLYVRGLLAGGLVSLQVEGTSQHWLSSMETVEIASDGAVEAQELLLPAGLKGTLSVRRLDLGAEPLLFTVTLSPPEPAAPESRDGETPSTEMADRGQSLRVSISRNAYRDLATLASRNVSRQKTDNDLKERVHALLTTVIGRDGDEWRDSATRSEPIVAFVGIAGMNKLILADSVAFPMFGSRGGGLSEPWQTTLERGQSVWVMYVEEDNAPYFTSIDVRFTKDVSGIDHDDFDPQGVSRWGADPSGGDRITVRVGYKRFRLPDRHDAAQVTISRQSANYGLRQWSSTFARYGRFPIRFAAGVMAGYPSVKGREFELAPVYAEDATAASATSLDDDSTRQPAFLTVALRWPQLRDAASQAPVGFHKLWRNAVPDPVFALGLPTVNRRTASGQVESSGLRRQTFALGFSWPMFGDRVHFVAAAVRFHEAHSAPGVGELKEGNRYTLATTLDQLRVLEPVWKPLVGISIDLARTW